MCQNEKEVTLSRSEAREQAFMLLFADTFGEEPLEERSKDNTELFEGGVCGYAQSVAAGMEGVRDEIDADISRFLKKGWSLSRISRVSLTILRLAIYEIKYIDSVPESVSINEAVELAKKYTIDESGFVNGILGSFIRSREGESK